MKIGSFIRSKFSSLITKYEDVVIVAVAVAIGMAAGVGNIIFRTLISFLQKNLYGIDSEVMLYNLQDTAKWKIILIPALGGLAVGIITTLFKSNVHSVADVIKANTIGTSNMLELAVFKKVEGFLFFSTGEVNGNIFDKKKSVKEDDYGVVDPLDVRNCYAESKRMGENMCASWAHQFNVPVKIVRPSHTYGPGLSLTDGRAFASFTAAVLNNRNIILKSNGEAKRSFCYIADAVRAYFLVLLNGKNGQVYNVSNDYEISIKKMAEIIINASNNKKLSLEFDIDEKSVSSKVSHGLLDNSKIKKLGWSPVIKEKEGFKRTLESFI